MQYPNLILQRIIFWKKNKNLLEETMQVVEIEWNIELVKRSQVTTGRFEWLPNEIQSLNPHIIDSPVQRVDLRGIRISIEFNDWKLNKIRWTAAELDFLCVDS